MRYLIPVALLGVAGSAIAADSSSYHFALSVKVGDSGQPVSLSATVPPGTSHTLQATKHLKFQISAEVPKDGRGDSKVALIDESSGKPLVLERLWRMAPMGEDLNASFVICEERVIRAQTERGQQEGSCAQLPPLAKPDLPRERCVGECQAPYEGQPLTLASRARIAPVGEPGTPMTITGRVLGGDGKPRAGIIVYAYQTDAKGIYPLTPNPRGIQSNHHGSLRGWALTDARGRYTFDTIRPGGYPSGIEPEHVHMHIVEPGCTTYVIDEMVFNDDPRLKALGEKWIENGWGGFARVTPKKDGKGFRAERDIRLGENIKDYPACGAGQRSEAM